MSPACTQEIGEGDKAPPEWLGEIEPTFLSYEAVPVLKFPFFNEVSLHLLSNHTPSATSIGMLLYARDAHAVMLIVRMKD